MTVLFRAEVRLAGERSPAQYASRTTRRNNILNLRANDRDLFPTGLKDNRFQIKRAFKFGCLYLEDFLIGVIPNRERTNPDFQIAEKGDSRVCLARGLSGCCPSEQFVHCDAQHFHLELFQPERESTAKFLYADSKRALTRLSERFNMNVVDAAQL